jgi:CheY-like chemotaxis protein
MKPLHLLITDDDPDKRNLLSRALTREFPHASLFECHSGQEALEFCARNEVDAIITNHNMAPVNGIELVTTLRRCGLSLPIIMVSGHDDMRAPALAAGVDLFLDWDQPTKIGKPIAEFLNGRGLRDRKEM